MCRINLPVGSVRRILALCPVCIWMGLLLPTPFSQLLLITLMHSLTAHIQTLSDSFTHTHTQICSLQSISCCPNASRVGARSLLPIWPTGLRERHLISPRPPDRRGLIVFPVRVKNGEYSSAIQEPRSGNFLIPLPPVLSSLRRLCFLSPSHVTQHVAAWLRQIQTLLNPTQIRKSPFALLLRPVEAELVTVSQSNRTELIPLCSLHRSRPHLPPPPWTLRFL